MKPTEITSSAQFEQIVNGSKYVVIDFHADWCAPCKVIAPKYEELSKTLSRPNKMTFVKVNVDNNRDIAQKYDVTAMPTFIVLQDKKQVAKVVGADLTKLKETVQKLASVAHSENSGSEPFADSSASGSGGEKWTGASMPRGYSDVTEQVDIRGLDLMNSDSEFGGARALFETSKPSALESSKGKGKATGSENKRDWVESDTDEQLMLFIPFNMTMKVHTIQLTSLPPKESDDDDDELPMRPKTIKIFSNRAHNLGFEEADDITPTQQVELTAEDWDEKTGTARLELRFVKFQNVTSIVLFVVDGDGDSERVRLDRIRIIGESGESRTMGKLEKIGDDS